MPCNAFTLRSQRGSSRAGCGTAARPCSRYRYQISSSAPRSRFGFVVGGVDERHVRDPAAAGNAVGRRSARDRRRTSRAPSRAAAGTSRTCSRARAMRLMFSLSARAGDPDRRMRLLVGPRPDVHRALVPEAALVVERAVVRRPGAHDEIDPVPQPLDRLASGWCWRRRPRRRRRARSRQSSRPREMQSIIAISSATRIGSLRLADRVAEDADARLLRLAREDRGGERRGGVDAGRRSGDAR